MRSYAWFAACLWFGVCFTASAWADDTDIYGVSTSQLPPNILIVFDNSGSMSTDDVPGDPYNPATIYTGAYSANRVYYRYCSGWWFFQTCEWRSFGPNAADLGCAGIKSDLLTQGYAEGNIVSTSPYACGNSSDHKRLRTGNYMNYEVSGVGDTRRRLDVAKEVVTDLINTTDNVRFGLMVFNQNDGGRLVKPVGTAKADLIAAINALSAETWTPLGETLAEAGLYFAGKSSWFNSGVTYTSPIQYSCQKNYILLMTDGEPTKDDHAKLVSGTYINGDTIGNHDGDTNDPGNYSDGGTDYLDDVAHYLYTKDVRPDQAGVESSEGFQNIVTYSIGFQTDQQLLMDTAVNGGGEYYTASNYSTLTEAFAYIISSIQQESAVFVAPVVPVSRMNRAYAGNKVYLGFFEPTQSGRWFGNLKSYFLSGTGDILDQNNNPATDADGMILPGATSRWSSGMDGPTVTAGGVGKRLKERVVRRNLYTYTGIAADLTHGHNDFEADNVKIAPAPSPSLVDEVYGTGKEWPLGDFIHSEPVIVHYHNDANNNDQVDDGEMKSYIFAGANDGMLHAFDDDDGSEIWGFIPPGQLSRLPLLLGDQPNYFIDGSPSAYLGEKKILLFGERRGGNRYYALDITDPLTPKWLYQIGHDKLVGLDGDGSGAADGTAATLGYSWSRPQPQTLKTGSSNPNKAIQDVFLLAGGYDTNQDLAAPAATDTVGRAIYTVEVETGEVSALNVNAGNFAAMTHSIVDVTGFDTNFDGFTDRVYAGDLGGHLFALRDDEGDGSWERRLLFDLPAQVVVAGQNVSLGQKFMYAPDATAETFGEFLFLGTGDREHPTDTSVIDALYAVKNDWAVDENGDYSTLTLADLADVTDNLLQVGDAEQRMQAALELQNGQGWYLRLTHAGEKIVSSPVVFGGKVFFTTYTPSVTVAVSDPCSGPQDRGVARLYAVDYQNGKSVIDFTDDEALTTEDRSLVIGTSIPSGVVVTISNNGSGLLIGVEGGLKELDLTGGTTVQFYYWREIFN